MIGTYETTGYLDAFIDGVKAVLVEIMRERQYDRAAVDQPEPFLGVGLRFMVRRGDKEFWLDVDRDAFRRAVEEAEPDGPLADLIKLFDHQRVLEHFRRAGRTFVLRHVAHRLPVLPEPARPPRPVGLVCRPCEIMIVVKDGEAEQRCSRCGGPLEPPGLVSALPHA